MLRDLKAKKKAWILSLAQGYAKLRLSSLLGKGFLFAALTSFTAASQESQTETTKGLHTTTPSNYLHHK